jgi:hypothetical protein
VLEVEVLGGAVEFGIYGSVVSSFATDLDDALQLEGEIADYARDHGMPYMMIDSATDEFQFVRGINGRMQVDVPNGIQTIDTVINHRLYGNSTAAIPGAVINHINYTVPVGKKYYYLSGYGSSNCDCEWRFKIDTFPYTTRRNHHTSPDVDLNLKSAMILVAGQNLTVDVMNRSVWGSNSEIETFIYGSEQSI